MPTARETVEVEVKIEFQMWCEICGNGICGNTRYKKGTTNEFTTYCEKCEKIRDGLEKRVQELEEENRDLESRLESALQND